MCSWCWTSRARRRGILVTHPCCPSAVRSVTPNFDRRTRRRRAEPASSRSTSGFVNVTCGTTPWSARSVWSDELRGRRRARAAIHVAGDAHPGRPTTWSTHRRRHYADHDGRAAPRGGWSRPGTPTTATPPCRRWVRSQPGCRWRGRIACRAVSVRLSGAAHFDGPGARQPPCPHDVDAGTDGPSDLELVVVVAGERIASGEQGVDVERSVTDEPRDVQPPTPQIPAKVPVARTVLLVNRGLADHFETRPVAGPSARPHATEALRRDPRTKVSRSQAAPTCTP